MRCLRGVWIIVAFMAMSCGVHKELASRKAMEQGNCSETPPYSYSTRDLPVPLHELKPDTALAKLFDRNSLQAANSIGVIDQLADYIKLTRSIGQQASDHARIERLELLQKIEHAINLSSLEISAVASEMDCEEERLSQIANYLKRHEDEVETKLTVTAIVVGAAGAITSALLINRHEEDEKSDYIEITSGLVEASVGMMILLNKQKVLLHHSRNALREIWEGRKTSTVFPRSVWYYLNYFDPSEQGQSPRYRIVDGWMNFGQIESATSAKKHRLIDLYFGEGGRYSAEQLYNRASMYDQLESQIKLMKQDLTSLSLALQRIK
ncbi:MAG TPA: hypothetical protein VFE50_11115 [Cyclobacteriaceae bacterium]|nr:hypothetical protein [Cyclobacteriaceae bacterium]